jgi:molecular chaperone GrpE
MTKNEENLEEKKIDNDIDNDLEELKEEISQIEEISEKDESGTKIETEEILKLKELLARTQADYQNFKMRTERDREDMIFFLKYDIFKKILPRVDDLERMIKNTPENEKTQVLYE